MALKQCGSTSSARRAPSPSGEKRFAVYLLNERFLIAVDFDLDGQTCPNPAGISPDRYNLIRPPGTFSFRRRKVCCLFVYRTLLIAEAFDLDGQTCPNPAGI
jgi:hypothetical protein